MPSPLEQGDAKLFAAGVRRVMAADLGVPVEEAYALEDARAFYDQK